MGGGSDVLQVVGMTVRNPKDGDAVRLPAEAVGQARAAVAGRVGPFDLAEDDVVRLIVGWPRAG